MTDRSIFRLWAAAVSTLGLLHVCAVLPGWPMIAAALTLPALMTMRRYPLVKG